MSFFERRCHSRGGAADSSQMSSVLSHTYLKEAEEEPFVCEEAKGPVEANPFDDSKQVPIAILNGKVVNDDEITEMDILIEGGKIVQVGKDLELPSDTHTLDAADKYIFPGAVNCDARFLNSCHSSDLEELTNRTKSAVTGGTTTVVDGAHAGKHADIVAQLQQNSGGADGVLFCNVGIKACSADAGCINMETLKGETGEVVSVHLSGEAAFNLEDGEMINLMKEVKEDGGVLCVDVKGGALEEGILEGKTMLTPVEDIEEILVRKICSTANQVGISVGLFNVCNPWCVQIIQEFRSRGLQVFSDILTNMANISSILPLDDNNGLILASNNVVLNDDQEATSSEVEEDWLSVAYHQLVNENSVSVSKFVELTSSNPARLHNLYPRKGCIKEGSDADLVIWDPTRSVSIPESGSCRAQLGVEKGAELYGVAEHVLVAGKLVVSDCQVRPVAKYGSYVQFKKQADAGSDATDSERNVAVKRLDIPGHEFKQQEGQQRRCMSAWDKRKLTANQSSNSSQFSPSGANPKMEKEFGMHQRPKSAHGVRHQQDSTFSIKSFY